MLGKFIYVALFIVLLVGGVYMLSSYLQYKSKVNMVDIVKKNGAGGADF